MHVNKICCNGNSINLTVENVKKTVWQRQKVAEMGIL